MIIKVTQEDIDKGARCSNQSCPVALALRRLYPDLKISVGRVRTIIEDKKYYHSNELIKFIGRFDLGKKVNPGEYKYVDS
jgi:hypothetical protein